MKKIIKELLCLVAALVGGAITMHATTDSVTFNYSAGVTLNTGGEQFAPYYIASNRGGTVTQQHSALINAAIKHEVDTTVRLSWGVGAEVWAGYTSSANYSRYDVASLQWYENSQHPSRAWVQQLYAMGKYRGVFLMLGQKYIDAGVVNRNLSSGDLIMSYNARPLPGVRAGFINFQNVPFTRGWLQVRGECGYYHDSGKKWLENHYNYYNQFITTNIWLNYKNFYLRTNPSKPLMLTVGAQAVCQFAGTTTYYKAGEVEDQVKMKADFKAFWRALIPGSGGETRGDKSFYQGNHLGSWDIALDYRLRNGDVIRAYYQSPWEDGSGLGMMNGFDGLWGIEYRRPGHGIVTGAVFEFLDLMNQSGPMHFSPGDFVDDTHPGGSDITYKATGSDDYYNNYCYNGYQNRGMAMGTPMTRSPLYNTDGYLRFTDNRMRGFHMAVMGELGQQFGYRAMLSWRKSYGTPFMPRLEPVTCTSMMLEGTYAPRWLNGLLFTVQVAHDHGKLYGGNNTGALLSVSYSGNFSLEK